MCPCSDCTKRRRDTAFKATEPFPPKSAQPQRDVKVLVDSLNAGDCAGVALDKAEIKPVDLHDKAEKAPGENPKDRLGVLKLPLRLIPSPALAYLARVMALGAKKYGPFNWRKNAVKQTVYLEAALRHIHSVLDGENLDPESKEPHEAHVMACMSIILDAKATGNLIDDRFTPGVFGKLVQEMQEKPAETPEQFAPGLGWIIWRGGKNPAPGLTVEYAMRSGKRGVAPSNYLDWSHGPAPYLGDITSFQVRP